LSTRYRKLPVEIDAVIWVGNNQTEVREFLGYLDRDTLNQVVIRTLEGAMRASLGDYIIRGVAGEFYPCKPEIFEATYEKV
jgi:hypothetical protein